MWNLHIIMITISSHRMYQSLLVDTIKVLAGSYMVTRGHLEYMGSIDDPNLEEYSRLRISGFMMRRYHLTYGQVFKKIAVLEGHHPFEEPCSQKFVVLIGDDCGNHDAIDSVLYPNRRIDFDF